MTHAANDEIGQDLGEDQPPGASGRPSITFADLNAVDVEAPIANIRSVDCMSFGDAYRKSASNAEGKQDREYAVYRLLAAIAEMHFKPEDRAEAMRVVGFIDVLLRVVGGSVKGTNAPGPQESTKNGAGGRT